MSGKWRIGWGITVAVLLAAVLLAGWGWNRAAAVNPYRPQQLIRFHVIANSDSAEDQALKYRVRDAIVRAMTPLFKEAASIDQAREIVRANLGYMRQLAEGEIRAAGRDYPVAVYLGHYQFPAKTYHLAAAGNPGESTDLTLPAGEYEAVRVVIGRGAGANWWCVLFPPLCFVDLESTDLNSAPATSGAVRLSGKGEAANARERVRESIPAVTEAAGGGKGSDTKTPSMKEGKEVPMPSPEPSAKVKDPSEARPAFKWIPTPAMVTLAPARRPGDGVALVASAPGSTPVELRLRLLDLLRSLCNWYSLDIERQFTPPSLAPQGVRGAKG
ncbi:stage II sporulation protein R [Desulfofundulus thermobenzoicus]|uniref:Stage II sporulation protein R n=1 Tax=Desulfofundulus thermobenzoicus TaxID=29376 RepID=A0A6N7IUJ2_9FIRM|nr:stage II sporulation protein R [Desulfofundulus thermobenzoicus]MQL53571.1 stage II sporulation protein R [Desulfofundulus thermobenzoicus]